MQQYSKMFAALLATVLSGIIAALTDNVITPVEWLNVTVLAVTAAAVFTAPNIPGAALTKTVLAVLGAVLTLATNLLVAGGWPFEVSAWLQLGMAALGALGVYAIPNRDQLNIGSAGPGGGNVQPGGAA